ncbi:MAG: MFS transporter [Chloroflexota bacterium]|nr:MFS transporter [Chloroflexota bacterium]
MATAARFGLARRVNDGNAKWWTLAAACFALFMAILDNLVVNVALPTIQRELDASTTQLQWIVSAYTLIFASLQITAGGLGDRFGRKRWFLIGIVLFTATSLVAAFASSIEVLIAARAVQGLGAALVMPLSLSLISQAFPPEERGRALGIWSAVSVSGLALGPVIGGLLVEYTTWSWIFLINVPVGIVAFVVTASVVRESRDLSGTVATDVPGTVLITGAIGALTFGLIEAGERGWSDGLILSSFAAAAALLVAFVAVEARTERPMVPLRFFRSRTFTGANLDAFAISFLIAGIAFSMTLYQQNVHGYSAVRTGLAMLPMVATMMIGAPISGSLVNRLGSSRLISLGMAITGAAAFLFLRSGVEASYLDILPAFVVMGLGMSLIFAPMTTAVLNSVETAKSGVASAVNGAVREIGTAFGIALLGTLMNRTYQSTFERAPEIRSLHDSADPALAPLGAVADVVGSGIGLGGRVVEDPRLFPGLEAFGPLVGQIRDASSRAFVAGMEDAMVLSGALLIAVAGLSYWLINDRVADRAPAAVPALAGEEAVATAAD